MNVFMMEKIEGFAAVAYDLTEEAIVQSQSGVRTGKLDAYLDVIQFAQEAIIATINEQYQLDAGVDGDGDDGDGGNAPAGTTGRDRTAPSEDAPPPRKNKLAAAFPNSPVTKEPDGSGRTFSKSELKEQFALGECATVIEALEMAVALMGRDGVCALIGCDPRPLGLALKGVQTSKRIAEYIEPLLPNLN